MGLIHIGLSATLDLVGQAPLMDEVAGAQVGTAYEGTDALLFGRRTYDLFAGYWPHQQGGEDDAIATLFNGVPKHVASRDRPELSWAGSTQLGPDLAAAVREIRDQYEHGPTGTVYLRYGLAEGTPATGDTSAQDRGVGRD